MIDRYKVIRKTNSITLESSTEKYMILQRKNNIEGKKTKFYLMKKLKDKAIFISSLHSLDVNLQEIETLEGYFKIDFKGANYILKIENNKAEILSK